MTILICGKQFDRDHHRSSYQFQYQFLRSGVAFGYSEFEVVRKILKISISIAYCIMSEITFVLSAKCQNGFQHICRHFSEELKCYMNFSVYLPPQAENKKCPALMWLSGLTCTEKNFIEKSGFQKYAEKHGIIVVGPDTSPRGCNIEGEEDSWDFGTGAGFYVDATEPKWKDNYRMYSYVTKELPSLIEEKFPVNGKWSISGHSMGGHGAIICALNNPKKYESVSAFAPIVNPSECDWGKKCLNGYLGSDKSTWMQYDSTLLAKNYNGPKINILIYQGTNDEYWKKQLKPENFVEACKGTNITPFLVKKEGYDHGYYFVSTFIDDHILMHAMCLNKDDSS